MWLFLCARQDLPALWAYRGLQERLESLELVTAEALAFALRWEHRVSDGAVVSELRLADGRTVRSGQVRGTLNRLAALPVDHLARAGPGDREYALQELTALVTSWLHSLPGPMLNRPVGHSLGGPWLHLVEWAALAARAGLSVPPLTQTSRDPPAERDRIELSASGSGHAETVFVVDDKVVGPTLPDDVADACRRLAELAGATFLGIRLAYAPDGERPFLGASAQPDLSPGGAALLHRLAEALA